MSKSVNCQDYVNTDQSAKVIVKTCLSSNVTVHEKTYVNTQLSVKRLKANG